LYGRETWLLALRIFENMVLRALSGSKVEEMTRGLKNYIMSSFKMFDKKK
jgi:hypothetical protein